METKPRNLQQAFQTLQTQCSNLLANLSTSLHHHQQHFFQQSPVWARVKQFKGPESLSPVAGNVKSKKKFVEERLAVITVYTVSDEDGGFVLVAGENSRKRLGLFCFSKDDAEGVLERMKVVDPEGGRRSKVVSMSLKEAFQLKADGVAFRFIPEYSQIVNALKEKQKDGSSDEGFAGVPVFQSQSLVLRGPGDNKMYRPVFFRKEDLEKKLLQASREQNALNPAMKLGDIQISVFEDILKGLQVNHGSNWDDVVFVPPSFDV